MQCDDCTKSYVGETGRNLKDRIKEHSRHSTRQVNKSSLLTLPRNRTHLKIWTTLQFCTKILTQGREDGLNPIILRVVTLTIGR